MYRLHSNYSLESLESLLSTHFMTPALNHPAIPLPPTKAKVDDAPVRLKPTITSAYQRQRKESLGSGSTASTNARTAPPSLGNTSNVSLSLGPFPSLPAPITDIGIGVSPLTSAPSLTILPHSPIASPHSPNEPATLHLHTLIDELKQLTDVEDLSGQFEHTRRKGVARGGYSEVYLTHLRDHTKSNLIPVSLSACFYITLSH